MEPTSFRLDGVAAAGADAAEAALPASIGALFSYDSVSWAAANSFESARSFRARHRTVRRVVAPGRSAPSACPRHRRLCRRRSCCVIAPLLHCICAHASVPPLFFHDSINAFDVTILSKQHRVVPLPFFSSSFLLLLLFLFLHARRMLAIITAHRTRLHLTATRGGAGRGGE